MFCVVVALVDVALARDLVPFAAAPPALTATLAVPTAAFPSPLPAETAPRAVAAPIRRALDGEAEAPLAVASVEAPPPLVPPPPPPRATPRHARRNPSTLRRGSRGCCSGGRIRTYDLWVMSPASYRAAPPRDGSEEQFLFCYCSLQRNVTLHTSGKQHKSAVHRMFRARLLHEQ